VAKGPVGDAGSAVAAAVAAGLRDVPDFPEPGIVFKDIAPLLADGPRFAGAIDAMAGAARSHGRIDAVAGIEARGFVLAGALAMQLHCGLLPVRKAGKLPPPTVSRSYTLEYGTATIEVPLGVVDGRRILVVDDVLATGGTLLAAAALIAEAGGTVLALSVLLEIDALGGRRALADVAPLHALLRV
jgi:adenine phosphoribosyltransferase